MCSIENILLQNKQIKIAENRFQIPQIRNKSYLR